VAISSRRIAELRARGRFGAIVEERLQALERKGYRATPQRRAIVAGLLGTGQLNVSADEICRRAREQCPTVNLATTYRTLDLLSRLGMAQRVTLYDGRSVFCPNLHPHSHGTCLGCGAVMDLPRRHAEEALEREVLEPAEGAFVVVGHRLEFYGYCAGCRTAAPARLPVP